MSRQSMPRSPYDDLDLRALEAMWGDRARAVEAAKRDIDAAGVTRPARDPFEREWLDAHSRGDDFADAEPLTPEQAAGRRPSGRRPG